jgi:hypothetical protein
MFLMTVLLRRAGEEALRVRLQLAPLHGRGDGDLNQVGQLEAAVVKVICCRRLFCFVVILSSSAVTASRRHGKSPTCLVVMFISREKLGIS